MNKGFVFGKFLPFHKGHQAMIEFAMTHCDYLTVLVCCSDKESIPSDTRVKWIQDTFEGNKNINIIPFNYNEKELPNTSVSSQEVSRLWADKFKTIIPDHTLLITSEPYGDYVAAYMNIQHIPFDPERKNNAISATSIRTNLFDNWNFLPNSVKPYYCKKIVLLGTESTGKTTLTQKLAKHFHTGCVLECGRDLIKDSNKFSIDDLNKVAIEHAKNIEKASKLNTPLLIIDTDIHITLSYANFAFGKGLCIDADVFTVNKADAYLYLNNDVPHVQDGSRLCESDRNRLEIFHRATLKSYNINYFEIMGNWDKRFKDSVTIIDKMIYQQERD